MSGEQKPGRSVANIFQQDLGPHGSSVRATTQLCGVRIPPIPPRVHLPFTILSPAHLPIGDTHWDVGHGSALRPGEGLCPSASSGMVLPALVGTLCPRTWAGRRRGLDPVTSQTLNPGPRQGHFSSWVADTVGTLQHEPPESGHRE